MWEKLSQVSVVLGIMASLITLFALLKRIFSILSWRKVDFWFEIIRKDPNEDKRKKAIEALVKIGKKNASRDQQTIIKKCIEAMKNKENGDLRDSATIILGRIGKPSVVPLIKEYENGSSVDKELIKNAFREMKGDKDVKEELLRLLNDKDDWRHRQRAVMALGEIKNSSVLDNLIKVTADKQHQIRLEAARVLGEFGDFRAVDYLVERIKDENELPLVKKSAVGALKTIGDSRSEVVAVLIQESEKEGTAHNVRKKIIETLGEMKAHNATNILINLLDSESIDIIKASIKSLCQICNRNALVNHLKDIALNHGNYEIRKACIESFEEKKMHLDEVREILEEVISKEKDKSIKNLALKVIGKI